MTLPTIARVRQVLVRHPAAKLRWSIVAGIVLVYLVTFGVVVHAIYPTPAPPKALRTTAAFFPLPVARVDMAMIWMGNYLSRYDYIDSFIKKTDLTDFTPEKTRDQVLDYLVENQLIKHLAVQQRVRITSAQVETAYEEIAAKPGVGGQEEVERVLKELYTMTPEAFKALIAESLLRERVEQTVFLHVKARHILVATQAQADDLMNQVNDGGNFEELAKQFSQDTQSRDSGGTLGSVGRGSNLPDPLEEAVFGLPTDGKVIVVKSDLGFHVLDTVERLGVIDQNFADWLTAQKRERSIAIYLPNHLDWVKKD